MRKTAIAAAVMALFFTACAGRNNSEKGDNKARYNDGNTSTHPIRGMSTTTSTPPDHTGTDKTRADSTRTTIPE
jgi:hypothetical protein